MLIAASYRCQAVSYPEQPFGCSLRMGIFSSYLLWTKSTVTVIRTETRIRKVTRKFNQAVGGGYDHGVTCLYFTRPPASPDLLHFSGVTSLVVSGSTGADLRSASTVYAAPSWSTSSKLSILLT